MSPYMAKGTLAEWAQVGTDGTSAWPDPGILHSRAGGEGWQGTRIQYQLKRGDTDPLGSTPSSSAYKVECKLGEITSFLLDQLPRSENEINSA